MKPIEKLYIYEINGVVDPTFFKPEKDFVGCWNEAGHSYLFFSAPSDSPVRQMLNDNPGMEQLSQTEMDYDQWEPSDALRPFDIPPLSFVPVWDEKRSSNPMEIILDPGVVFGAGTHSTTYKCIEFLITLMQNESIGKVLDLGTGTGILAIAAAKLGAEDILAVDNNNLAVETAEKNVKLNNLTGPIECVYADAADYLETNADLTLANLILWELEKMFIPGINYGSKWYIVSGLNRTDVQKFKEQLNVLPFEILRHEMDNLWSTLLLKNTF